MYGFVANPYTHRREHSFHIQLYNLLLDQEPLRGMFEIGNSGYRTQLIHKEWPSVEKTTLRNSAERRQTYDIAVLSPAQIQRCTRRDFAEGRLSAPIAFEVGLDYDLRHLKGDLDKFDRNAVTHPYIVHFTRKPTRQSQAVEELILATPKNIKTAFVHLNADERTYRIKRVDGEFIETGRYEP